jgi:hypothetical protein
VVAHAELVPLEREPRRLGEQQLVRAAEVEVALEIDLGAVQVGPGVGDLAVDAGGEVQIIAVAADREPDAVQRPALPGIGFLGGARRRERKRGTESDEEYGAQDRPAVHAEGPRYCLALHRIAAS